MILCPWIFNGIMVTGTRAYEECTPTAECATTLVIVDLLKKVADLAVAAYPCPQSFVAGHEMTEDAMRCGQILV